MGHKSQVMETPHFWIERWVTKASTLAQSEIPVFLVNKDSPES